MDIQSVENLFRYTHLPPHLQEVSRPFYDMATKLFLEMTPSAELTLAIRKLWEAKNLAVYSAVATKKD